MSFNQCRLVNRTCNSTALLNQIDPPELLPGPRADGRRVRAADTLRRGVPLREPGAIAKGGRAAFAPDALYRHHFSTGATPFHSPTQPGGARFALFLEGALCRL